MGTRPLTLKQRKFVTAYLGPANGNATEAARIAGYKGSDSVMRYVGSTNLALPNIAKELERSIVPVHDGALRTVEKRVHKYVDRVHQMAEIIAERRADPEYGKSGELGYEPGARSGWLARKVRINRRWDKRSGEMVGETVEVEYKFDAGLAREMRELEKQIAIELRQWSEKKTLEGPDGGPLLISEIQVLKQILPPEAMEAAGSIMDGEYVAIEPEPEDDDIEETVSVESEDEQVAVFDGWSFHDDDD